MQVFRLRLNTSLSLFLIVDLPATARTAGSSRTIIRAGSVVYKTEDTQQ